MHIKWKFLFEKIRLIIAKFCDTIWNSDIKINMGQNLRDASESYSINENTNETKDKYYKYLFCFNKILISHFTLPRNAKNNTQFGI